MSDSLYRYAARLDKALKRGTRFAAFNKDLRHASVVVCVSISHASTQVRLLSENLDPDLYAGDWFMEEASRFLDRGGRLSILVESDLAEDHRVLELVREYPSQVTIRRVAEAVKGSYTFNFMVVDNQGYRFERDRREPQAVVVFNGDSQDHKNFVQRLIEVHNRIFSASTSAI